ncbi:hypothetical protein BDZ89DRAFT_1160898 [Hymenopellis radicata]|nr:hypothetical protein BDZ89DRAFT_1160898 [Hymenopellis radicata]
METTSSIPTPTALERLFAYNADEYFIQIFDHLAAADLYRVVLTCKKFYRCGVRALYSHVVFKDRRIFHDSLRFWDNPPVPGLISAPTTLTIVAPIYDTPDHVINFPHLGVIFHAAEEASLDEDMVIKTFCLAFRFTSLSGLRFISCPMIDTQSLSLVLLGFPNLRQLVIRNCTFCEPVTPHATGYAAIQSLPITSLILVGNRSLRGNPNRTHAANLELTTAPCIRALSISWVHSIAPFYVADLIHNDSVFSPRLEELYIGVGPLLDEEESGNERAIQLNTMMKDKLVRFLRKVGANLHTLRVDGLTATPWSQIGLLLLGSPDLPRLHSFSGPATLAACLRYRECRISDNMNTQQAGSLFVSMPSDIIMLEIRLVEWDVEILHAVTQTFRRLQTLTVMYAKGHPDDYTYLSMPMQFFDSQTCPDLKSLSIFCSNTDEPPPGIPSPTNMRAWNKRCRTLTRVQWEKRKAMSRIDDEWYSHKSGT